MAERRIAFRLPVTTVSRSPGAPGLDGPMAQRAVLVTDYGLRGGRLVVDGRTVLVAPSREALTIGVSARLPGSGNGVRVEVDGDADPRVWVDGVEAIREEDLCAPTSRSAVIHGWIALAGSFFGFVASYVYLLRARSSGDLWALKMSWHMAAWHLLLTLTLFPASVWGQRIGIRAVQATSLVFFLIHLGIAAANAGPGIRLVGEVWLAGFNAASGLAFLAAVLYGQRAHADMDPTRGLASAGSDCGGRAIGAPRASESTRSRAPRVAHPLHPIRPRRTNEIVASKGIGP